MSVNYCKFKILWWMMLIPDFTQTLSIIWHSLFCYLGVIMCFKSHSLTFSIVIPSYPSLCCPLLNTRGPQFCSHSICSTYTILFLTMVWNAMSISGLRSARAVPSTEHFKKQKNQIFRCSCHLMYICRGFYKFLLVDFI